MGPGRWRHDRPCPGSRAGRPLQVRAGASGRRRMHTAALRDCAGWSRFLGSHGRTCTTTSCLLRTATIWSTSASPWYDRQGSRGWRWEREGFLKRARGEGGVLRLLFGAAWLRVSNGIPSTARSRPAAALCRCCGRRSLATVVNRWWTRSAHPTARFCRETWCVGRGGGGFSVGIGAGVAERGLVTRPPFPPHNPPPPCLHPTGSRTRW